MTIPFDREAHNNRIAQQVEAATLARARKEMRALRDADRRFYRLGTIIFLAFLPFILGPVRFAVDLAFDNMIAEQFTHWRKFSIIPMLTLYAGMAALAVWAIFHRRY